MTETNGNVDNANVPSQLEADIIEQVEYYFGDINLPRDKFLGEQVKLDDGWIPLDVLTRFKRLAKLTTDTEVIATALSKSVTGLLEISDDNKKVRRNPEMPAPEMNEELRKDMVTRSLYVKGFPKDSVMDDLLTFFKPFGGIQNLYMRKYLDRNTKTRQFKGSVFVTLKDAEEVKKFVESDDLKYGNEKLIVKTQEEYIKEKQAEHKERREKKEKKMKDNEKKDNGNQIVLPTGAVLKFETVDDKLTREVLKNAMQPLEAEIAYIFFKTGEKEGWVRFAKENAAKETFEKLTDGKLKVGEHDVTFRVLEGDEEKEYLDKTIEDINKRRTMPNRNKKGNWNMKGNMKGKHHGNRKRKQGAHSDAPKEKVAA